MTEHPTLDRLWSEFLAAAMIVFCTAIGGLVAYLEADMYTGEQPIVGLTAAQQQDQYKTAAAMMNGYSHVPADVTCSPFGPRRWRR